MLAHLLHLFVPRSSNNHHAHLIQPAGLALVAAIFIFANASVRLFAFYDTSLVRGNILGFASSIIPEAVIEQTNQERAKAGKPPLKENPLLSLAAQAKAGDMFAFNYWAHVNPQNAKEPWAFIKEAGYSYKYAGENLARDFGDTAPMVAAWIASPSHRENILSDRYDEIGIAVVNGTLEGVETTLVVQMFGRGVAPVAQAVETQAIAAANTLGQNSPLIPQAVAQENPPSTSVVASTPAPESTQPLISPLAINKAIAMSILLLLSVALIIDYVVIKRSSTHRVSGKGLAHLSFIGMLIIVVLMSKQGGIL